MIYYIWRQWSWFPLEIKKKKTMNKESKFHKKSKALDFWDSRNTRLFGTYCKGVHQAKMTLQMIKITKGIEQILVIENN